ncbi:hypothetical protein BIW11_04045 [Tropilaelaps mercedesae]|uniref:Uncharacterized protein n=1 Tax=Tropilaelaps mercedesae TaxID=418985 RepID=A0A1V9XBY2_9ACAR|nr:hypothetical protein BIW11_04045 [Tropilaelaps mercedesae]
MDVTTESRPERSMLAPHRYNFFAEASWYNCDGHDSPTIPLSMLTSAICLRL